MTSPLGAVWVWLGLALAAQGPAPPPGLEAVSAEPNLEKRAGKALDYASHAIDRARKSYRAGQWEKAVADAAEAGEAVELAYQSLVNTGKNPSRSPKHFKRAELRTRQLVRRLESLAADMSFDEREPVERVRARVQKVNEDLLAGIMSGKKK